MADPILDTFVQQSTDGYWYATLLIRCNTEDQGHKLLRHADELVEAFTAAYLEDQNAS